MHGDLLVFGYKMLGHLAILVTGAGVYTVVDFTHTITLGSVLVGAIFLVAAGVITVRSKIASIWREEAEGERAAKDRLAEELAEEKIERAEFEKDQQVLRHDLKNELGATRALLKAMEAKTDLTAALDAIREMNEAIVLAMQDNSRLSESRDAATHQLLTEIRDKLPNGA